MSTFRLNHLFAPSAIAIVGASDRKGSMGAAILAAILDGEFPGEIYLVNPKHREISGRRCYASVKDIKTNVDLVVIATPAAAIPDVIDDVVAAGAKAVIILTAGLGHGPGSISEVVHQKARSASLRVLGPNCLGMLVPSARLNASFARSLPKPGPFALISQSGAVAAGLTEWAAARNIGFSAVVSLGDAIDIDVGDCLDHFAEDAATKVILLYMEGLREARKFMSAARKAARIKPVIVLKSGRHGAGAKAAATHTGALAGADIVYEAAFRRAGCIRVLDLDELFTTAETLASPLAIRGERLAILTNGGGLGVLAVDRLADVGGTLAAVSDNTLLQLDRVLPPTWSKANPVDIIGDAPPDRYRAALNALLDDPATDAILVLNCPTAMAAPEEAASAVIGVVQARRAASTQPKPVFSVWLGAGEALVDRFEAAGIPSFATEAEAVLGISRLMEIHRQKDELLHVAAPLPEAIIPDRSRARTAVDACLADHREWLNPVEVYDLLSAYGISTVAAQLAKSGAEAAEIAGAMLGEARALAVKIHSRDIVHKSDVDGVRLGLVSPASVSAAASEILERAKQLRPEANIAGVTLHPMIERPQARELFVGMAVDPTFGPVIVFGQGGTAVEVINDKALGLLPVDIEQARALIARTRVARLLKGYRNVPAVDQEQIAMLLVRVSRLVEDNPEIVGLDLNPVLSDAKDAITVDARVQVAPRMPGDHDQSAGRRFAIRPYPRDLEGNIALPGGEDFKLRPIRPDDDLALEKMLARCSPHDLQMRFLGVARSIDRRLLSRLTQLDYGREMAFVVIDPASHEICAVARLHGDANHETAEFAVIVRTDLQRRGLGNLLMKSLISFGRDEGYTEILGYVLDDNRAMLALCDRLGFRRTTAGGAGETVARLSLKGMPASSPEAAG